MIITIHLSLLLIPILIYIFWWGFLGCAALYGQWHTSALPIWVKYLAAPGAVFFLVFDVLFNYTIGTVLFLNLPPDGCYTLTRRLTSYLSGSGYRMRVAHVVCAFLLNPFQVGGHCKP